MLGRLTKSRFNRQLHLSIRPRSGGSQIIIRRLVMSNTKTDLPQEVAPVVDSAQQSSDATRKKFDTRSELSEQVGTDTVRVRDGKTPRQVLLEQIAIEEN